MSAAGRPLLKPPAVLQEETPGPIGADRLQNPAGFGWSLLHGAGEQDQSLGIVAGPVARLGQDPRGDRAGCLGPGPIGHCRLLHASQRLECRLWLALLERFVDGLPGGCPWFGGSIVGVGVGHGHGVDSEQECCEGQQDRDGAEHVHHHSNEADAYDAHGTVLRDRTTNETVHHERSLRGRAGFVTVRLLPPWRQVFNLSVSPARIPQVKKSWPRADPRFIT